MTPNSTPHRDACVPVQWPPAATSSPSALPPSRRACHDVINRRNLEMYAIRRFDVRYGGTEESSGPLADVRIT